MNKESSSSYGNGQLLVQMSGSTTTYYQSDHLSVRMTTDSNGNVLGQQGHFPFGELWYSSSGNTEWMFTTYQHDQETGLGHAVPESWEQVWEQNPVKHRAKP